LELINSLASNATNNSIELRKTLESSQYKDIFNFIKYGNWIKTQILEPISEILHLLEKNHTVIKKTIVSLESDISNTKDPSLQKPLMLQKERLELQKNSYESTMELLNTYKEKLS
jgi:predicted negative regulator of RcsB-dependent stress response